MARDLKRILISEETIREIARRILSVCNPRTPGSRLDARQAG